MVKQVTVTSAYAGFLLSVLGAIAWATGRAFVFPSLGPSAYLLASVRRGEIISARYFVGGHAIGVVAGLVSYAIFAPGLAITGSVTSLSPDQLRLVGSAVTSVTLTTAGMTWTEAIHPPACATTLIVSLGILSTPLDGAIIVVAIGVLFSVHVIVMRSVVPELARLTYP
ncbi:HPP family protein [Halegenticoccus tardaugens]|uniref:HPP family protein n=1 Tax=Halegenticoccus tardaugens TaxID=2071624 RepID=UPI00100B0868|nr:HPP family protein [Halegenticoccus tardaugens]